MIPRSSAWTRQTEVEMESMWTSWSTTQFAEFENETKYHYNWEFRSTEKTIEK